MDFYIKYTCVCDIGSVRKSNQDNIICDGFYLELERCDTPHRQSGTLTTDTPRLFGIFDGMGGEECGEVASYIAARTAAETLLNGDDAAGTLRHICLSANDSICDFAQKNNIGSTGTTAAMLLFSGGGVTLCNIGDSRIYWYADNVLEQVSVDHVIEIDKNKKAPLSQCLGIPPQELLIDPYISLGEYEAGDSFVICSDGLTDALCEDEIASILDSNTQNPAKALFQAAIKNGSRDNVSVIVIEIEQH